MKYVAIAMVLAGASACSTALGAQSAVSLTNLDVTFVRFGAVPPLQTESMETFGGAQVDGTGPRGVPPVDGFLVPLEAMANAPDASASAIVSDGAGGPGITLATSATDNGSSFAAAGTLGDLIVPANTTMTLSADFHVSGTGEGVYELAQICIIECDIRTVIGTGASDFTLTETFSNVGSGDTPEFIDVYASANAVGIPEPGERLMLLAGLALICATRARRRAAPATSR